MKQTGSIASKLVSKTRIQPGKAKSAGKPGKKPVPQRDGLAKFATEAGRKLI
jgi:hypothetical protein